MLNSIVKPRLRWPLNYQTIDHQGQRYLLLQDQQGVADQPAFVPMLLVPILSKCDGNHTIEDLFKFGSILGVEEGRIKELVQELDKAFFLDSPESRARIEKNRLEYRKIPIREPVFAGGIYPADPRQLKEVIEGYLSQANGSFNHLSLPKKSIAMIAPHIDYSRGWKTYAAAYSALMQIERPDVLFLLGTSHQPGAGIFHLTEKSFNTPFGLIPTEKEVVRSIARRYGEVRAYADEMLHKREHSLELQLPFIAHRFLTEAPPSIVPILVGSFHEFVLKGVQPIEIGEVQDFVGALAEVIKDLRVSGKTVLLYGGVDFAHVGRHFGDSEVMSKSDRLQEIERRDRQLLEAILLADEEKLFAHIATDHDRRRICGFPSIYLMLAAMRQAGIKVQGHYIDYRQAVDLQTDCVVTFAATIWSEAF